MSVSASLEIEFSSPASTVDAINSLLKSGWTYNDNGKITYLPLGDDDMFNWKITELAYWDEVLEVIKEKVDKNEIIGVILSWKDSMVGAEFLFHPDKNYLSVCLSVNRKMLESSRDTDFSWYIPRIIEALEEKGFSIKKFKREQTN